MQQRLAGERGTQQAQQHELGTMGLQQEHEVGMADRAAAQQPEVAE